MTDSAKSVLSRQIPLVSSIVAFGYRISISPLIDRRYDCLFDFREHFFWILYIGRSLRSTSEALHIYSRPVFSRIDGFEDRCFCSFSFSLPFSLLKVFHHHVSHGL